MRPKRSILIDNDALDAGAVPETTQPPSAPKPAEPLNIFGDIPPDHPIFQKIADYQATHPQCDPWHGKPPQNAAKLEAELAKHKAKLDDLLKPIMDKLAKDSGLPPVQLLFGGDEVDDIGSQIKPGEVPTTKDKFMMDIAIKEMLAKPPPISMFSDLHVGDFINRKNKEEK